MIKKFKILLWFRLFLSSFVVILPKFYFSVTKIYFLYIIIFANMVTFKNIIFWGFFCHHFVIIWMMTEKAQNLNFFK